MSKMGRTHPTTSTQLPSAQMLAYVAQPVEQPALTPERSQAEHTGAESEISTDDDDDASEASTQFESDQDQALPPADAAKAATPKRYTCVLCDKSFTVLRMLRMHETKMHDLPMPHTCSVCGDRFHTAQGRNRHHTVRHPEAPSSADSSPKPKRARVRSTSARKPGRPRRLSLPMQNVADDQVEETACQPETPFSEKFQCEQCTVMSKTLRGLAEHRRRYHRNSNVAPKSELDWSTDVAQAAIITEVID